MSKYRFSSYPLYFILPYLFASSLILADDFTETYNQNEPSRFDSVIIFGDSLSDQGGELGRFDRFLAGGFSNLNYVEIIAPILTNQPILPNSEGGTNYAQAGSKPFGSSRTTQNQINRYLASVDGQADTNALFIINVGGNDFWGSQ
ncbi:MAG: SGNH/GDSL hydrolase family protein, partial [Neisseriaceae bacterium]|nr:SGNH/GDSL hydrolase family protein [Neisseriaceae bacterium]